MKTRWYLFFLTMITVSVLSYNLIGSEKSPAYKVGVVMVGDSRYEKYTGLRAGLTDLGYKDEDFSFIVKNAKDDPARLKADIEELQKQELDLIVTLGGIETTELKRRLEITDSNIPVVFAGVAAPKEVGIINDYQSPRGSFTGINNYHTGLSGKRLEIFRDLVPNLKRVFALYDKEIKISRLSLEKTIEAGEILSVEVVPVDVSNKEFMEIIQEEMEKSDALFILPSYRIESLTEQIVRFSKEYRLPVMGLYEYEVKAGYVASYGTSFHDQGYQAARFVSLILQGNAPGQLPVELPDVMRFLVNKEVMDDFHIEMKEDLQYIRQYTNEFTEGEDN